MTDEVDYTALQPGDMLAAVRDDAFKWATAFCQHAEKLGHHGIDHGWMIGWFANAIEHSGDVRRWAREAAHLAAGEAGEGAVPVEPYRKMVDRLVHEFEPGHYEGCPADNIVTFGKCQCFGGALIAEAKALLATSPTPAATVPPAGAMDAGTIEAAGSAEAPVAWRYRHFDNMPWTFTDTNPKTWGATPAVTIDPLFARGQNFRAGIEAAARVVEDEPIFVQDREVGKMETRDKRLAAAIRALAPPDGAGEGWQAMDTAPKDGSDVCCLAPEYKGPVMLRFHLHDTHGVWCDWDADICNPTAWFRLPSASGDGADKPEWEPFTDEDAAVDAAAEERAKRDDDWWKD